MHQTKLLLIYPPYLSGAGGQGAPPPSPPAGRVPARVSLREPSQKKKNCKLLWCTKRSKKVKKGQKKAQKQQKNQKIKIVNFGVAPPPFLEEVHNLVFFFFCTLP